MRKTRRRLVLTRETLRHLDGAQLERVVGGDETGKCMDTERCPNTAQSICANCTAPRRGNNFE